MSSRPTAADRREAQGRLFWAWLLTFPILFIEAAGWWLGAAWPSPLLRRLALVALAFPVVFVVGDNTFRGDGTFRRDRTYRGVDPSHGEDSSRAAGSSRGVRAFRGDTTPSPADRLVAALAMAGWASGLAAFVLPVPSLAGAGAVLMAGWLTYSAIRRTVPWSGA